MYALWDWEVTMANKLLNLNDMQQILNCSKSRLYQLVKEPDFPSFKIGREHRVFEDDLIEWINKQSEKKKKAKEKKVEEVQIKKEKEELIDYDHSTYLSLEECAKVLRISDFKMSKLYKIEGFPYIKLGNAILIPIKEFNEWTEKMIGKKIDI